MFYGGVLIAATDADHDSYKRLGLLCPHCKDAVFLQAPSQRQGEGKIVAIPTHFKHFKAKDPALVKECENRVNKYDAKEIRRSAARARNQRLRLLQRRFWEILTVYYEQKLNFPVTQAPEGFWLYLTAKDAYCLPNQVFSSESDCQLFADLARAKVRNFGEAGFVERELLRLCFTELQLTTVAPLIQDLRMTDLEYAALVAQGRDPVQEQLYPNHRPSSTPYS